MQEAQTGQIFTSFACNKKKKYMVLIKIVNIGFEILIFFHPISMRLVCYCFCSKNDIFGIKNSFHKVFEMHRIFDYKKRKNY